MSSPECCPAPTADRALSDAFAGGFLAGVVEGKSLSECVDRGQWLARLSLQELGPSYPQPKQTYPGKA